MASTKRLNVEQQLKEMDADHRIRRTAINALVTFRDLPILGSELQRRLAHDWFVEELHELFPEREFEYTEQYLSFVRNRPSKVSHLKAPGSWRELDPGHEVSAWLAEIEAIKQTQHDDSHIRRVAVLGEAKLRFDFAQGSNPHNINPEVFSLPTGLIAATAHEIIRVGIDQPGMNPDTAPLAFVLGAVGSFIPTYFASFLKNEYISGLQEGSPQRYLALFELGEHVNGYEGFTPEPWNPYTGRGLKRDYAKSAVEQAGWVMKEVITELKQTMALWGPESRKVKYSTYTTAWKEALKSARSVEEVKAFSDDVQKAMQYVEQVSVPELYGPQ